MKLAQFKAMVAALPASADQYDVEFESNLHDHFPIGEQHEIDGGDAIYDAQGNVLQQARVAKVSFKQA